jgi:two-component system, cell cycle sensor histidine kinase and response regulator CckA
VSRAFLSGLRGRLALLVVLAAVPAFGLSYYANRRDREHQLSAVVADTVRLARAVANDQERIIEGTRQILSDLSAIAEIRARDAARARTLFALLMKQWRGYASFTLIDAAGTAVVSLPPIDGHLDFSERSWFQRALQSGEFTVGEYQVGQITGKQIVVAAWPVVEEGRVTSVIAAALDLAWLNQIAAAAQTPPSSVLFLVDRRGAIVARHPDAPQWIGRPFPEAAIVDRLRSETEGSLVLRATDGVDRVYAFTPVRGRLDTGLRLVIGVPRETAFGAIERHQSQQALVLLLVAGLTMVLAWVGAERLVLRRVASLLEATRRLAAGDRSARTAMPYGHGELSELARAFDEMASALEAREAERQRAETALRESEERFRAFMENTPTIAFVKDEAGHCVYANGAFERRFGMTREQWFGRTDAELWPSQPMTEKFRRDDLRVLATDAPHQIVESITLPDGTPGYWMTVKFPLRDAAGRRLVGGVSVDLTDWRQAQSALANSERRYEQLVEQAWDAIVLLDADRRMVAVNTAACRMTGYSREELAQMRVDDLVVPSELAERPFDLSELRAAGGIVAERTARRKDGSLYQIEVRARLNDNGQIQAIVRDVTGRHAVERALRDSEERYRLLYQYLPLAYQTLDEDGTIVEVNDAWQQLTGMARAAAVNTRFDALLAPNSQWRFLESLAQVVRSGEVHDLEVVLLRGDRATVTLSMDLRHGRDARGRSQVHCVLDDVTAARTAASRLRESEARYRSLFADSPVALWEEDFSGIKRHLERLEALGVSDLRAHFAAHREELADCIAAVRVTDVNKATLALYRAETRSELLAGLDRIIGQDGYDVFESAIVALANGERFWKSDGLNYTMDGEPVHLALQWSLAPGAEQDWSRVLVSVMDVSDRVNSEAALRESEARFARVFASSPGPMAVSDLADGRLIDVNEAFVREFGYSRAELIGRTSLELGLWVLPGVRRPLAAELAEVGGVQGREVQFRRKDGRVVETLCWGVPLQVGGRECALVQIADITARKRAEESGRESQRMLATLMSNLPGMAYQCCNDPEWTMLFVSEGCRELTGYEPSDLIGNRVVSYASIIAEDDRDLVEHEVRQALAENRAFRMIYRIRRADGEMRWVWEQGRVGQVAGGEATILDGFVADITDRRRAEEELRASTDQLRHAQKMEAVGRLAGGIAHDFNNLLTAILGFADLALAHLAPGDPLTGRVEEIRHAGERAADLTRQLLAFSRKQAMTPQVVALDEVIRQMAPMMARLIGENIELGLHTAGGNIRADATQIEQVLLNLVVNARDAMPRGGRLDISTACVQLSEAEAAERRAPAPGDYVELAVADTGTGMDEATKVRMFEPFFTTKPEGQGTGLGLSTVYGIVHQAEGGISADSEPGRGAIFRVLLPRVPDVPDEAAYPTAPVQSVAGSETVLVAEDEEAVRRLIRSALERHGYQVLDAADGVEGLALLDARPDAVDLLLTDVVMPRLDGPALVAEALARRPDLRVIYLSGYSEEMALRDQPRGTGAFLRKPFTATQLVRLVRAVLDGRGAEC